LYSIYADGVCVYDDVIVSKSMKALNPKLVLEDNSAGSLSMTLTPENSGYSTIIRLISDITVKKDGIEIWSGRVLSENMDFWNNRVLYCEGELAFFNDSIQPPAEYTVSTIREYLQALVTVHNSKVGQNRRFTLGAVTVNDARLPTFYTNYEKTLECLNDLIENYGGHMRVRNENGVRYLDYLSDYPNTCTQIIQFGTNLIDFTRQWDMTEFATVIVPLGKRLDESPIEALDAYVTVASVNEGSIYVQADSEVINAYGRIEKTVTWDDVENANVLLQKARLYLSDLQFDNMVLELSALDLHYLNVEYESVKMLDQIRVISRPHGLDRLFPVTKLEIPLDSPEKTQFKLGDAVRVSLTQVNNQTNSAILQKIDDLPKVQSVLKEAKENAEAIMNLATNGYITITKDQTGSEALIISSERDYTRADKYWKWNMNGLAYYNRDQGSGQQDLPIAITMDGSIVADYITTGTMSADRIRAGILESVGENRTYEEIRDSSGQLIKDSSNNDIQSQSRKFGNVVFDLNEGTLLMKKGSIQLGQYSGGHYQFEVDDTGRLYAGSSAIFAGTLAAATGSFGGELVAASGSFRGVVTATDFINAITGESMFDLAKRKIKSGYLDLDDLYIRINNEVDGLSTRINLLPGQIMTSVASEYVSNEGLTQRLKTSVTLNPDGILISNATGQKFTINTAENISMSFSNLTDYQTKQNEINAAASAGYNAGILAGNAQTAANNAANTANAVNNALTALENNIGYTYIDGEYVISPTIIGGTFYATNAKTDYLRITSDGLRYYKNYSRTAQLDWYLETDSSARKVVLGSFPYSIVMSTAGTFKVEAYTADFSDVSNTIGLYLRFTS